MASEEASQQHKIGSVYIDSKSKKLCFNFNEKDQFIQLVQDIPINEDCIKLMNNFVLSDLQLQVNFNYIQTIELSIKR